MTFLILTHTFHPDIESEGQYVSAVAAELVKHGHTVTMLSGQARIATALARCSFQLSTPPRVDVVAALSSAPSVSKLGSLFARALGARFKSRIVSAEVDTVVADLEAAAEPEMASTTDSTVEHMGAPSIAPAASSAYIATPLTGTFGSSALLGSRPLVRGVTGRASPFRVTARAVALPPAHARVRRSQAG